MKTRHTVAFLVIKWVLRSVVALFMLSPIYATLCMALTPYSNILEAQLYPRYFAISNFAESFNAIALNLGNSFFYSITCVCVTLVITVPVAYVLARHTFKGKTLFLYGILLTQMMAGIVLMPSLYKVYSTLGLLNSRGILLLTFSGMNIPLTTWLLIGFFSGLPREIEEAAYVDGISFPNLLLKIIIPMSGPGLAVAATFIFINSYNEFLVPLFLISEPVKRPLTLKIYTYLTDHQVQWHLVGCASLIGLVVPTVVFLFFQKYIIGGITSGAVKS